MLLLTLATLSSLAQLGLPAVGFAFLTHFENVLTVKQNAVITFASFSGALHQIHGHVDFELHSFCVYGLSADSIIIFDCTKTVKKENQIGADSDYW